MNDEELKNESIERYLLMEMTTDERKSFEKEIAQNSELKEQVALYKALYATDDESEEWITTENNSELIKKKRHYLEHKRQKTFLKHLRIIEQQIRRQNVPFSHLNYGVLLLQSSL